MPLSSATRRLDRRLPDDPQYRAVLHALRRNGVGEKIAARSCSRSSACCTVGAGCCHPRAALGHRARDPLPAVVAVAAERRFRAAAARPSPTSTTRSNGPSSNTELEGNVRFHAAGDQQEHQVPGLGVREVASSRSKRSVMPVVEMPIHIPMIAQNLAFERAWRRARAAVRIEDFHFDAMRARTPAEAPEHRREGGARKVYSHGEVMSHGGPPENLGKRSSPDVKIVSVKRVDKRSPCKSSTGFPILSAAAYEARRSMEPSGNDSLEAIDSLTARLRISAAGFHGEGCSCADFNVGRSS